MVPKNISIIKPGLNFEPRHMHIQLNIRFTYSTIKECRLQSFQPITISAVEIDSMGGP